MNYQPSRTRIAERAGMIRAQGARMDDVHVIRAGEPTPVAGATGGYPTDEQAVLIRYGVALLIEQGARFDRGMVAFLDGRTVVAECVGGYTGIDLPEHAIGGAA